MRSSWFGFTKTAAGRRFALLSLGQLVSVVGSRVAAFAGSVWILQTTGQVADFGVSLLCTVLPGLVLAPWLGQVVDRRPRRQMLLGADFALLVLALLGALAVARGSLWGFWAVQAASSVLNRLVLVTLQSSTSSLVEDEILPSSNALFGLAVGVGDLVGPLIGGFLVGFLPAWAPFALDAATFGVSLLATLTLALQWPSVTNRAQPAFFQGLASAAGLVRPQRVLTAMLMLSASLNASIGLLDMLVAPVALHLGDARVLGGVLALYAFGAAASSAVASAVPMPRPAAVYAACGVTFGTAQVALALWPGLFAMRLAGFIMAFAAGVSAVASTTEWQRRTPTQQQGSVFAFRSFMTEWPTPAAMALATVSAGPLSSWVSPLAVAGLAGGAEAELRGPALLLLGGAVVTLVVVAANAAALIRAAPVSRS
ncbi:MAG: MFS transporter [Myxococcaceae bacterium]|nr:MFS transporter [Myxococcaceae bacterium]